MPSLREQVRQRAKGRCEYCQLPQTCTVLPHEIDHILAQKHRGQTSLENLCFACAQCNASKGPNIAGYDPMTAEVEKEMRDAIEFHLEGCATKVSQFRCHGRKRLTARSS